MPVWGGHSCPPLLTLPLNLFLKWPTTNDEPKRSYPALSPPLAAYLPPDSNRSTSNPPALSIPRLGARSGSHICRVLRDAYRWPPGPAWCIAPLRKRNLPATPPAADPFPHPPIPLRARQKNIPGLQTLSVSAAHSDAPPSHPPHTNPPNLPDVWYCRPVPSLVTAFAPPLPPG